MEFNKNAVNAESSQVAKPTNYVMAARDDGLVREEKNNRVVSREDTTKLTEIEDVRHFGDFSDAVSHSFMITYLLSQLKTEESVWTFFCEKSLLSTHMHVKQLAIK